MIGGILAHQGGWDEIALVLGPIAVIYFALRVAKQRAEALGVASGPDGLAETPDSSD